MASAMDNVVGALVTLWSGLPALAGVTVYDGPAVGADAVTDMVIVGDDADPEYGSDSGFSQEWVDLAQTRRVEIGEILCVAVSQAGATDVRGRRDRAFVLLGACEDALRLDETLGGIAFSALITAGSARPLQNSAGSAMIVPFTVRYRAQV